MHVTHHRRCAILGTFSRPYSDVPLCTSHAVGLGASSPADPPNAMPTKPYRSRFVRAVRLEAVLRWLERQYGLLVIAPRRPPRTPIQPQPQQSRQPLSP